MKLSHSIVRCCLIVATALLHSTKDVVVHGQVLLGQLEPRDHNVSGVVYLLSDTAFEVRNFTYDGAAPDSFFWIDTSAAPTSNGTILADGTPTLSCGSAPLTTRANGTQTYRVEFPAGTSIMDYLGGSISVWCKTFAANFGEVVIPTTLDGLSTSSDGITLECSSNEPDDTTTTDTTTAPASILELGPLAERDHGVSGDVYLLSDRVLEIRNLTYDGAAPDAYFWADTNSTPTADGFILLDATLGGTTDGSCGTEPITAAAFGSMTYRVEFPEGKSVYDIVGGSISIWCRTFAANFGEIIIPTNLSNIPVSDDLTCDGGDNDDSPTTTTTTTAPNATTTATEPTPIELGPLAERDHGVSGTVFLISDRVLEIRNLTYDGAAPDSFFWADTNSTPTADGFVLLDAGAGDTDGSCGAAPLTTQADGTMTYRVEFPEGKSVNDILGGSISIWCKTFAANFGEIIVPSNLSNIAVSDDLTCDGSSSTTTSTSTEPISLGPLAERDHDVSGDVYILSDRALEIRNLTYDGAAPDAYFWADTSSTPTDSGFILLDGGDTGSCGKTSLTKQLDGSMTYRIEFPAGQSINDILGGSISIWCRTFAANFGEIVIPANLTGIPASEDGPELDCQSSASELSLGVIPTLDHQAAGEVFVISDRILEIRGFAFDGAAPDTFFWADSNSTPSADGFILNDVSPTTSCGTVPLAAATGTDVFRVEFPEGKTIKDILGGSIAVWCKQFSANFGHVVIPETLDVEETLDEDIKCGSSSGIAATPQGYNCEQLNDDYQVRWLVEDDMVSIELVGRLDDMHYFGFGPSGASDKTQMDGADPVIADYFNDEFRARDYYMISKGQCSNGMGVCADTASTDLTDDVSYVSGEKDAESGLTVVRYKRPLTAPNADATLQDQTVDISIDATAGVETFVVWAIGPISPETGDPYFHSVDYAKEDISIEFGRTVVDNCEPFETTTMDMNSTDVFERPMLKDVTEFNVVIGPSGEEKGYSGITGRISWGIAWYVNDLLIPVIELRRGTKYTFRVNGGDDPAAGSQYHPFYLTTSASGGYAQLTPKERMAETIVAGVTITETTDEGVLAYEADAVGPLCSYQYTDTTEAALLSSYEEYFATLDTSCAEELSPEAGVLEFTPDETTPDTIYYHCVTHRNLGWEIKVIDADAASTDDSDKEAESIDDSSSAINMKSGFVTLFLVSAVSIISFF